MRIIAALALWALLAVAPAQAQAETLISAAVLRVDVAGLPPISRLDLPPADLGLAGARLGTDDNATTGSFLVCHFSRILGQTLLSSRAACNADVLRANVFCGLDRSSMQLR